jgi:tripartite-type tricarboxylate transporter receptor subunit TctC
MALFCGANGAAAQEYPSKPVRLIVPFAPGAATDAVARNVATKLTERLGQSVVVENRTGAGGNLAYDFVAKSPADGYTLLFATTGIATNASLYKQLPYDVVKDLAPITLVARSSHVLVVQPSLGVNSVKELIALAKSKPGMISYGSSGSGTILHLAGEMMNMKTGTGLVHVPYRGGTLALQDLLGGSIQMVFVDISLGLPQVKAGKLRALGVTGDQRTKAMPDVPTIAEAGIPGYAIDAWFGIFAPAGTPGPIVKRLNRELNAVLADPDLKKRMLELGQELAGSSPEEFSRFLRSEIQKMGEIVRTSGASAN